MTDPTLTAVALAAGEGRRLRPLTFLRPKPLCPVDNVALIDHALGRVADLTPDRAVNLHHGRDEIAAHLAAGPYDVHLSIEEPEALGTAGALGQLRGWIDGRDVVAVNADTWCPGSLATEVIDGWDRERVLLVVAGEDHFGPTSRVAAALMPWSEVAPLVAEPTGLYEASWGRLEAAGRIDVVRWDGPCLDCGTPARYLGANLVASRGRPVVGPGARLDGTVERSVVWPGGEVAAGEHLVDAIRTDHRTTVLVR